MRDIPDKGMVLGIPAAPDKQAKRQMIALQQLPELIRRTRELEKQVAELRSQNRRLKITRGSRLKPWQAVY